MEDELGKQLSPSKAIADRLESLGWTQADLAQILGKPRGMVSELLSHKRSITHESAALLAGAFGTTADYWIQLQAVYDMRNQRQIPSDVVSKAEMYGKYPIREMVKRGWLSQSVDAALLNKELSAFFQAGDFPFAARRKDDESKTPLQIAWLHRAQNIADAQIVKTYSELALNAALEEIKSLTFAVEEIIAIPRILGDAGIRFLIVEALPTSKIDGVCFWLDFKSPVIALSLRYDRIDHFWFTLMHECMHVKYGHGRDYAMLDTDVMEASDTAISTEERLADDGASQYLVPKDEMDDFIARVNPLFTYAKIIGFARRMRVHPGIVVGQLQHSGLIQYSEHRKTLVAVRNTITQTTLFDGWGTVALRRSA